MYLKNLFFPSIFLFLSCESEKKIEKPIFSEIRNPLDKEEIKKSTIAKARELTSLWIVKGVAKDKFLDFESGKVFSGWVKRTMSDGSISLLFECKDGFRDGIETSWFANGKKFCVRNWKEGIREGPYEIWYAHGMVKERGYNEDNLQHGKLENFYGDGTRKSEFQFRRGKLWMAKRWKPDGSLCPVSTIRDGIGILVRYDEVNQSPEDNQTYRDGVIDYGYDSAF